MPDEDNGAGEPDRTDDVVEAPVPGVSCQLPDAEPSWI